MKHIYLILILSFTTQLTAQQDTLYFKLDDVYNTNWVPASKKEADFYRPMPLERVGDLYKIKDYYIEGTLQMEGLTSDLEGDMYQGNTIWYYKNGKKEIESVYKDGVLNGLTKTYYQDGTLKTEGTYKDDEAINGTFTECCPGEYVVEKKNGKRIAEYHYYKNTKVISEASFKDNEEHTNKIISYDTSGKQIAEVTVEFYDIYVNGKRVWFDTDSDRNITTIGSIDHYKNKELHGESIVYDADENILAQGIYQNNYPYSGTFYNYDILKTYEKGILEGKEIAYSKDKIIAQGINKNGSPWQGQFKSGYNKILNYEQGALEGKQTMYYADSFGDSFVNIKSYYHTVNGQKEGECAFFNEDGKQITKGIFKNDQPWQGTFYDDYYKKTSSYKEGKKHGLFTSYTTSGEMLSQEEYVDGKISGLVKSTGYFKNRTCECHYLNGEPFNGEVCEELSVLHYKKGKIAKSETFNDNDQVQLKEMKIYDDKGEVVQATYYHENKSYELKYKNGLPYEGVKFTEYYNTITTYKDGVKNGPFIEYSNAFERIEGTYKDDKWHGVITFTNSAGDKTTSCTYIEGKPIDGTIQFGNCVRTYKNGLKTGMESCEKNLLLKINNTYTQVGDSYTRTYKNGILDGDIHYFNNGVLVNSGTYVNGSKYEGTFYEKEFYENRYEKGKIVENGYYFADYFKKDFYVDSLISEEKTYKDSKLLYHGEYKNGKKHNGTFVVIDDIENPEFYTIAHYKHGKKQGVENTMFFGKKADSVIISKVYNKGVITEITANIPFKSHQILKGSYKNGKPFTGLFYNANPKVDSLTQYQKGIKKGYQYYAFPHSNMLSVIDSINYVNGKPINGAEIKGINDYLYKDIYKEGQFIQTNIYENDVAALPDIEVLHNANGFDINAIVTKWVGVNDDDDELEKEKVSRTIYSNKEHTAGKTIFYAHGTGEEIGSLTFSDGQINTIDLTMVFGAVDIRYYKSEEGKVVAEVTNRQTNEYFKYYLEKIQFANFDYVFFANIHNYLSKGDGTIYFYLDQDEKPYTSCTIRNGEPYQGNMIFNYEKDDYILRRYKAGKEYEKVENLTKKELLKRIETYVKH